MRKLPYEDAFIDIAVSNQRAKKSWFANYKLSSERLGHIYAGHTHTAVEKRRGQILRAAQGKETAAHGVYYDETMIVEYIDDVLTNKMDLSRVYYHPRHRSYNIEYDFGKVIGYEMNLDTNTAINVTKIRISLDKNGKVRTAFPVLKFEDLSKFK